VRSSKDRNSFVPLVKKIQVQKKFPQIAAMRYGLENEPIAQEACAAKFQVVEHHSGVVVTRTSCHIGHLEIINVLIFQPMGTLCATI